MLVEFQIKIEILNAAQQHNRLLFNAKMYCDTTVYQKYRNHYNLKLMGGFVSYGPSKVIQIYKGTEG